jgi:hypothetical protein
MSECTLATLITNGVLNLELANPNHFNGPNLSLGYKWMVVQLQNAKMVLMHEMQEYL